MKRALIAAIAGALILAGGAWLLLEKGDFAGRASRILSSDKIAWDVGYRKNQLNRPLEAIAEHEISGGGSIFMKATCDSENDGRSITLDFEYHAKNSAQNNDADSYYETEGSGAFEHVAVPYRFDGGAILQANSQTKYKNSARAVFVHIASDAKASPGDVVLEGFASLFGGVQDLQQFLHAREVTFQLPLGGGNSEIVSLYPRDSSFQTFVRTCKINLNSIDADVAKQRAAEQAAAKAKADEDARAAEAQKQQQDAEAQAQVQAAQARQQSTDAVRQICTTGGNNLRIAGMTRMEDVPDSGLIGVYAFGGQNVDATADPAAVAAGACSIEFSRNGHDIAGKVPLSALEVAQDNAATALSTGNP